MATKFLKQFDDFTGQFVPEFAEARPLYARALRGEEMESLRDVADAGASMYSQAGAENALRSQCRNLDKSIQRGDDRGFTPELQDAIRKVNKGSTAANVARWVGKAAPKGIVSLGMGTGIPFAIGSALGGSVAGAIAATAVPAIGTAGADVARRLTSGAAREAELIARAGGAIRPAGLLAPSRPVGQKLAGASGIAAGTTAERDRREKKRKRASDRKKDATAAD